MSRPGFLCDDCGEKADEDLWQCDECGLFVCEACEMAHVCDPTADKEEFPS